MAIIWGQFCKRYLSHHLLKLAWNYLPKIKLKSPRGQWVNPHLRDPGAGAPSLLIHTNPLTHVRWGHTAAWLCEPRLNLKSVFPGVGIPVIKIRWLWDRYNGNSYTAKTVSLYLDTTPLMAEKTQGRGGDGIWVWVIMAWAPSQYKDCLSQVWGFPC